MHIISLKITRERKELALSSSSFLLLGLAWFAVSQAGLVAPFFLPSLLSIGQAAAALLKSSLLADVWASSYRIALGFGLAAAIAVPTGLLVAINRNARAFLLPLAGFIRYIPPSALVPLAILWLGIGEVEKVAVIFASIAPYLLLLAADVAGGIRQEYFEAAQVMGMGRSRLFVKILLPAALPGIWEAMRIMVGAAWSYIVFAEMVAAENGIGHLIMQSQRYLQTPKVMVGILVVGLLGIGTDCLFRIGYRKLFPWVNK